MESESAQHLRAQLVELRAKPPAWIDGYDLEFLVNILTDEPNFDYLSAISRRRVDKITEEAEFRRRHPTATWA